MKVKEVKKGDLFTIDNTLSRPKLKLEKGYIDMVSNYIWEHNEEVDAFIMDERQIEKCVRILRITREVFDAHKKKLSDRYIGGDIIEDKV